MFAILFAIALTGAGPIAARCFFPSPRQYFWDWKHRRSGRSFTQVDGTPHLMTSTSTTRALWDWRNSELLAACSAAEASQGANSTVPG